VQSFLQWFSFANILVSLIDILFERNVQVFTFFLIVVFLEW